MNVDKGQLETISDAYVIPDIGQRMDAMLRSHMRDRLLRWAQGPEVLEMGAGDMTWTGEMIARFGRSSIVDGSSRLLEHAASVYGEHVVCYDSFFEAFTPPDGRRFNTVLATHVLEHVDDPVQVLRRSREWLAEGGRMIVAVPNATSLHRRIGVKMGMLQTVYDFSERDHLLGHQRVYDLDTLRSDVLAAGYRIVHTEGFLLKVLPLSMMGEFSDSLIRAFFDVASELPPELSSDLGMVLEL